MANYTIRYKRGNFFSGFSITNQLILINVVLFVAAIFVKNFFGEEYFLNNLAITPSLILSGTAIWSFVTSMFMHGSFFHLFANMFSLFFIGNFLEKIIGKTRFIWIYIISGLMGGAFFVISGTIFSNNIPGVGASGAIFGLLGVLAFLVPKSKIYLIAGPLVILVLAAILGPFFPVVYSISNVLIILMIFAIFSFNPNIRRFAIPIELPMWILPIVAIVPLVIIGFFVELPIGNSAHIGGLVVGVFYGFYLRKKFPKKVNMLSRHFR